MFIDTLEATSDQDKASLFNEYFYSVFTPSSFDTSLMGDISASATAITNIVISDTDVYSVLASLDPSKSSGIDGIGPKVLKYSALALYIPFHHLFSLCMTQCSIPSEWKMHRITPIFKAGDRMSVKNYRPISLLCNVSKVLERLIFDKVSPFVTRQITMSQFGFLRNHSSVQQILKFLINIVNQIDNKCQCDVIYLDFRKAFNSVPHKELLHKLRSIGIKGSVWKWFECYLSSRVQCVAVNDSMSDVLPVLSGVPQGSILGPLLFIIYVNDLPSVVSYSKTFIFADDTKCSKSIMSNSDHKLLQEDLNSLSQWSREWKLLFNESKFRLLQFRSSAVRSVHTYNICGQNIEPSTCHKDLGILLTDLLTWEEHYNYISSRAYKQLGLLKRTFPTVHVSAKKNLYLSLVRSQLTYCSPVWRPQLLKHISFLEKVQRRSTKYILNDFESDYKSRLISLNLFPLMYWIELADIMLLVTLLKYPDNRLNILEHISFSSTKTRSSTHLKLKQHRSRTNLSRHFYFSRICRLWNALPPIDLTLSTDNIRRAVKRFLWSNFIDKFNCDILCTFHFVCPCTKCSSMPNSTNCSQSNSSVLMSQKGYYNSIDLSPKLAYCGSQDQNVKRQFI